MKRILLYWYDHRGVVDAEMITKGLLGVFDGKNCPVIIQLEDVGWDQLTFGICSEKVSQEVLVEAFQIALDQGNTGSLSSKEDLTLIELD